MLRRVSFRPAVRFATALLFGGLAWSQDVLVVDVAGGPGSDFTEVDAAVSAAASGSILLVRDGFYSGEFPVIDGKSLTIVAEAGTQPEVQGQFLIRNLALGDTVTLSNIKIGELGNTAESLVLLDNVGTVQLDGVEIEGGSVVAFTSPHTLLVTNCDSVVVSGCTMTGGRPGLAVAEGGAALRAVDSSVHVYDSHLVGGQGVGDQTTSADGGPGVQVLGGFLYAQGSTFEGGQGGSVGSIFGCNDAQAGDGGPGLFLGGTAPDVRLLDPTLLGGAAGTPTGAGSCTPGNPGPPSEVTAGNLVEVPHPTHAFALSSPVRADETVAMSFSGVAGEFAWYLFAADTATLFVEPLLGTLTLDFPLFAVPAGTLDGAGTLGLTAVPPLTPGAEGEDFYLQALFFDGLTGFTLSQPGSLVVLDPAF